MKNLSQLSISRLQVFTLQLHPNKGKSHTDHLKNVLSSPRCYQLLENNEKALTYLNHLVACYIILSKVGVKSQLELLAFFDWTEVELKALSSLAS
jgi:hypothetical protein